MNNDKALREFLAQIQRATETLITISMHVDNHMGIAPEAINWGHAGSAAAIAQALADICAQHGIITGE